MLDLHFPQRRERPAALRGLHPLGQILDADALAAGPHRRLLHHLAQLVQVLGPAVGAQHGFGLWREVARGTWAPLEEVARERPDVVGALAQRGELERLGREPPVQVLAEQPGRDAGVQVDARAGDHPGARRHRRRRVQALQLVALEQLDHHLLKACGQLVHLGEQHRADARLLEDPHLVGRGAAVDAQELGFDERIGEVPAVDHHEGMCRPLGEVVDGASGKLAAAPRFPEEQDRRLARRQAPQLGK